MEQENNKIIQDELKNMAKQEEIRIQQDMIELELERITQKQLDYESRAKKTEKIIENVSRMQEIKRELDNKIRN